MVKDAGDDPDCTDGARITATVAFAEGAADSGAGQPGTLQLRAGDGVGTITLPGLGLEVGAPAINPVPRAMITAALAEVTDQPLIATFSVPGGQAMATRTTNERLGIIGGISTLGTTGIVRPFSTPPTGRPSSSKSRFLPPRVTTLSYWPPAAALRNLLSPPGPICLWSASWMSETLLVSRSGGPPPPGCSGWFSSAWRARSPSWRPE